MSETHYCCVIYPVDRITGESECPTDRDNCVGCENLEYIGTLGGEYYVKCAYGGDDDPVV